MLGQGPCRLKFEFRVRAQVKGVGKGAGAIVGSLRLQTSEMITVVNLDGVESPLLYR